MSGLRLITAIFFALGALCSSAASLVWSPQTNHVRTAHLLTNLVTEFNYTNTSAAPVIVTAVETSCHCTTPQIPKLPWTIPAHAAGKIDVVVEVPGKWGLLQKTLTLQTATETNTLM